jgi:hypothetical protein
VAFVSVAADTSRVDALNPAANPFPALVPAFENPLVNRDVASFVDPSTSAFVAFRNPLNVGKIETLPEPTSGVLTGTSRSSVAECRPPFELSGERLALVVRHGVSFEPRPRQLEWFRVLLHVAMNVQEGEDLDLSRAFGVRHREQPPVDGRVSVSPCFAHEFADQVDRFAERDPLADVIERDAETVAEVESECGAVLLYELEERRDSPRRASCLSP